MAVLQTTPEDEERDLREQLASLARPAPALGSTGPSGGAPSGGGGAPAAPGQTRPTFTGVGSYLRANESSNQALGQKVVGSVEQSGADARGALGKAVGDFDSAVNSSRVDFNPTLTQRLSSDPTGLANDPTGLAAFTRQRDASYGGPHALEESSSFGDLQDKLRKAEETRTLAGSDQGLSQLSDRSVTGTRTAGGRSLDTALLLGDPNLRGKLDTARTGLGALQGEVGTAGTAAGERATAAEQTTAKTREDSRSAITDAQGAFDKALNERVDQQRLEAFYRAIHAQDALKGYNAPALQGIPNVLPGQVVMPGGGVANVPQAQPQLDPGLANLSPQEIAALQALSPADQARLQAERQRQLSGGFSAGPSITLNQPGPVKLDPGLANLTPAELAALRALPPADLARLQEARQQQLASQQTGPGLPTTGAQGRYYDANDPTRGGYVDGAKPGNVPEFIHGGSGGAALPGFNDYLGSHLSRAPSAQELADIGLSPVQWAELAPLFPVGKMANAAAFGTENVNPYSFLEQYGQEVGDLSRFANIANPNVTIQRENVANAGDYARANALATLAGPELQRMLLDPAQSAQAGTANLDLVDFDVGGANAARDAALAKLAQRTDTTIAGNARSGDGTVLEKAVNDPFGKGSVRKQVFG